MGTLPVLWLLTPFATGILIARSARLRAVADRYWAPSLALGWLGVGLLLTAVFALSDTLAALAFVAGGPLAGLSFLLPRPREDGGGPGPDADEHGPGPSDDEWERFVADFWRYVEECGTRERVPA
ncbi:MAG: hypothetical protein IRZ21_10530 [Thermoleophilaceae bacterium]|nr:hypothetical protein [Thermoleophilaceae bacterium]